jgi:hypothetical protein
MVTPLLEDVEVKEILEAEAINDDNPDIHSADCCFTSVITQIVQFFNLTF